jgi:hypothetical protein
MTSLLPLVIQPHEPHCVFRSKSSKSSIEIQPFTPDSESSLASLAPGDIISILLIGRTSYGGSDSDAEEREVKSFEYLAYWVQDIIKTSHAELKAAAERRARGVWYLQHAEIITTIIMETPPVARVDVIKSRESEVHDHGFY